MTASDRERTRYYSTRPRRVPPEFCSDELLEECSLLAALLLYRIISQADDQGRLPGAPKYIRVLCFGMRPAVTVGKVAAALTELVGAGFLIRYDYQGRVLLQVDRWQDLQGKWGRRAYASRYPAPPGWSGDWVSIKDDEPDAPDVRAPGTQDARTMHSPIPVPSPVPSPVSSTGRLIRTTGSHDPERVGGLLERADRRTLSNDEALAMGMALLDRAGSEGRAS